jgi:hypothetical protein
MFGVGCGIFWRVVPPRKKKQTQSNQVIKIATNKLIIRSAIKDVPYKWACTMFAAYILKCTFVMKKKYSTKLFLRRMRVRATNLWITTHELNISN